MSDGPGLACPGCGSPDVDLRRGLLCGTCDVLPAPGEWNAAVQHSLANPAHVLIPFLDAAGAVHVECLEPGCGFDTFREEASHE